MAKVIPLDEKRGEVIILKDLGVVRPPQVDHAFIVGRNIGPVELRVILKSCATYAVPFESMEEAKNDLRLLYEAMKGE